MNKKILALTILLLGCCLARADERMPHTFVPASFGAGSESLIAQLECPEKRGPQQRTAVFCQAHVRADGRLDRSSFDSGFCFGAGFSDEPGKESVIYSARRYVLAVERVLKTARFLPAKVDGVAVPVFFPFQVVFDDQDSCVAKAYPNLGLHRAELGTSYVAPQEIVTERRWIKRIGFFDPFGFPAIGIFFSSSVLVNENGTARSGRVEYTNPASLSPITLSATKMAARAATALEDSQFIPGFYEGKPFPMRYLGILFVGSPLDGPL